MLILLVSIEENMNVPWGNSVSKSSKVQEMN